MSPTTLGMQAVGDPNLLRQIERGRSPSLRTADRVLAYIAAFDQDPGRAQAPPGRTRRSRPRGAGEENAEEQSGDRARDGTENETANPLPAGVGGAGPDEPGAEHDLPVVGRGSLPPAGLAERARGALGRGRGRGVAPRADRGAPVCGRMAAACARVSPSRDPRGRVSTRRRPVRRVESGHPQRPPTGLADAAKGGEPAYPPWPHSVCLPEGPGGGLCPL